VRAGAVQLVLSSDSAILMSREGANLTPVLQRGSVNFRVESGGALLLIATDVRVRPQSSEPTVGQMTLEACAVVITSRTQALEVVAGKETKIVQEGQSYRVVREGACDKRSNQTPLAPAHSRFLLIPVLAGIATIVAVHKAYESPDRP
jgi:ferric-dicitrate binding protein FerR (iron transport regulator)